MEDRYYTPEETDIRVGYECFWMLDPIKGDSTENLLPIKFTPRQAAFALFSPFNWEREETEDIKPNLMSYRTSFLTKKQIEAEGWEFKSQLCSDKDCKGFETTYSNLLDEIIIYFSICQNYKSHIWTWSATEGTSTLYRGECKSINEFRTICKWLKI